MNTTMPQASLPSALKVLSIQGLLETVLANLSAKELARLRSVCKGFDQTITHARLHNLKLQLLLLPTQPSDFVVWNPHPE